ncbi:MAG: hypothetical protein ACI4AQ_01655 [Lachnospiraceae bacterium]
MRDLEGEKVKSLVGTTEGKPTKREIKVGATPELISFDDAIDILSHHKDYDGINEERRGIYLREYTADKSIWRSMQHGRFNSGTF